MKILSSQDLDIHQGIFFGSPSFYFIFKGSFEQCASNDHTLQCQEYFHEIHGKKVNLIWDFQQMEGYDSHIKPSWKNYLEELKTNLNGVVVVSHDRRVRGKLRNITEPYPFNTMVVRDLTELSERSTSLAH